MGEDQNFFSGQKPGFPEKQGLYDPLFEKDACGMGFLCNINGVKSNEIIQQSLEVLRRLAHRGASGADPKTGDGAGILIQIPDEFFRKVATKERINLPEAGEYGTGLVFLPPDLVERNFCKELFAKIALKFEVKILGWR